MKRWLVMAFTVLTATFACGSMAGVRQGKPANLITSICWSCLSSPTLDGMSITTMGQEDTGNPDGLPCTYTNSLYIGIKTGLWELARRVDATRTPYCFVSLGDIRLDPGVRAPEGEVHLQRDNAEQSNYQVCWYADPILYWLEVILDSPYLETGSFDVVYIIGVDPTQNDDELTMLLSPETFLFGNPTTQVACAGDCVLSSAGSGSNALFWCVGRQGLTYPFSDHVQVHVSHAQASSLLVQRMTAKLHHEFLMRGTPGVDGLCDIYPEPVVDKTQYEYQILYPIPQTERTNGHCCQPYGRTTVIWGADKSYPYADEDSIYIIFHEKNYYLGVGF